MKKTIAILLCVIIAAALLSGCGAMKDAGWNASSSGSGGGSWDNMAREEMGYGYDDGAYAPMPSSTPGASYNSSASKPGGEITYAMTAGDTMEAEVISNTGGGDGYAEKIIYTASADIETIEFDETINNVYELMALYGAFIEDSYVGGRNYAQSYHGWQTHRTAHFTLRVPVFRLAAMTESLEVLGNVISLNNSAQNITSQFYDTESRLSSYRTQEERLLAMLAKADTVADMIDIEQRLAEVRYSIESMTTTLRNWQNQVDYSTLTIYITEVAKLTEAAPPLQRSYWEQIGDGFGSTLRSVGNFFMQFFKWIVVNIPILAILAVLAIGGAIIPKRMVRRSRMKKAAQNQLNMERQRMAAIQQTGAAEQPVAGDNNQPPDGRPPESDGQ